MAFSQAGRPMRVTTPLGADAFLLDRLVGDEGVSTPFVFTLDLLSTQTAVDPTAIMGKAISITIDLPNGQQRYYHGLARRFVQLGQNADALVTYRAEVVPQFWFMSLSSNCRVFQNKSVPDIVKQVFGDFGLANYRSAVTGTYPVREYCVQYRETAFDFVSRLLEEEGIFYYFEHAADKHTLVLADAPSALKPGPMPKLPVVEATAGGGDDAGIVELEVDQSFTTGKVALTDYNMETPSTNLLATTATTIRGIDNAKLERFDYPGGYATKADGDRYARVSMERLEVPGKSLRGRTSRIPLASGEKFDMSGFYRSDVNGSYQVMRVRHSGANAPYKSAGASGTFVFQSEFFAIPAATPFRPPRVTPKALVNGTQTALVVGPSGEEIYVDKFGRVKVQFFWDREGKKDANSSCWVRVATSWAGKNWGVVTLPRIGQEVVVDFLEGDPDQPLITGSVYNAEQMPPYDLPANMTQSGLKSRSSKQGGTADFNEIRFEDKKGSEMVTLHAQKDLTTEVENDETRSVMHDRTTTIKNNETKTVSEGDEVTNIGKGKQQVVISQGDQVITLSQGSQALTISAGGQTVSMNKDRNVTINSGNDNLTVQSGGVSTKVAMGNHDTKVDTGNVTLKAGLGAITYEGMQGIELKVGQNSIKIDQSGISIKGLMVKIEGQVQTEVKGLMTTVKGDAMLTVKGGITMIN